MGATPELSAIVLCYRAEEAAVPLLEALHRELVASGVDYELVLVANYDEGRRDRTPDVAARFAAEHAATVVVAEPKRGGMGWDMRRGLDAARGEVLVVVDGDGQYAPADVVRIFRALRASGADVVKGRRTSRADGVYRRLLTLAYNVAFAVLFPRRAVRDVNGKPKAIARRAYERLQLRSDDWFADAELVLEARRLGMRIEDLPVAYGAGSRGSFVKPGAILEFARNMLRYRLRGHV
ncbi:MAG TPA: glycosyltransferase family 2 protein [Gaiellaceae bacterium]|nr:glycosyltransferase family 2 protein [Gaiellaceae bacterium]